MSDIFYVSDEAYEYLVERAIQCNFVREDAIRKAGMSRFVCRLSWKVFADERPIDLRKHDDIMLSRKRVPIWYNDGGRRARLLDITDDAIKQYVAIAVHHRITMGPLYKGGPHVRSVTSITGAVLEAIGLQFLVPNEWPQEVSFRMLG